MKQTIAPRKIPSTRTLLTQLGLALVMGALWLLAISARPYWIRPWCLAQPQSCTKDSVFLIDRLSLGMEDSQADYYSAMTQNAAGVIALLFPLMWHLGVFLKKRKAPKKEIEAAAFLAAWDWVRILQVLSINGFFTEISHALSQRPRPFVYQEPLIKGIDPAHYTSFYSGHTSFTAAALAGVFFLFLQYRAPKWQIGFIFALGQVLVISTAYFRILAGRHFLTDVLCGAIAGCLVAWITLSRTFETEAKRI